MAWIFQRAEQVEELGERKALWYVGYRDPSGRVVRKKKGTKSAAKTYKSWIETELAKVDQTKVIPCEWKFFVDEYE